MNFNQKIFSSDMLLLLGVSAVPVDIWTISKALVLVPSWLLSNTLWDFIGSLAYTLFIALLEILVIFLALVLLRVVIPARWGEGKFLAFGFLFVVEFTVFVLLLQFNDALFWQKKLLLIAFIGVLAALFLLVHFIPFAKKVGQALVDRFAFLGWFFLIFNLVSAVIVVIRNVF